MSKKLKQILRSVAFTFIATSMFASSVNVAHAIKPEEGQEAGLTRQIVLEEENTDDSEVMLINETSELEESEAFTLRESLDGEVEGEATESNEVLTVVIVGIVVVLGAAGAVQWIKLRKRLKEAVEDNESTEK